MPHYFVKWAYFAVKIKFKLLLASFFLKESQIPKHLNPG